MDLTEENGWIQRTCGSSRLENCQTQESRHETRGWTGVRRTKTREVAPCPLSTKWLRGPGWKN